MDDSRGSTFKPSDFMRNRRPEYYSDSKIVQKSTLTKDYLEYHLNKITDKKQEYLFENFAKALAEKEICPNLIPQTGPLGGGDSKRDSENYPISDEISEYFFSPIPKGAKEDHWAFAISASKKWKQKVKKDVEKIVNDTNRVFNLIFYISNRLISDKKKAETQDNLQDKYNIEVQILDANWIIEKVFKNSRQELVYDFLDINLPQKQEKKLGPKDTIREERLKEIKNKISTQDGYKHRKYVLVEDFLRAAKLSRSLEKAKSDTLGLFDQAISIAKKVGIKNQIVRALYNKAWTCFWWFDDASSTLEIYQELEDLVIGSENYSDLELLSNLYVVLFTAFRSDLLDIDSSFFQNKKDNLFESLERIADDETKPSNSINAKALKQVLRLSLGIKDEQEIKDALIALNNLLSKSDGYLLFEVDPLIRLFDEIGGVFEGFDEYDDLFETICEMSLKREGEIKKGELLLRRGLQNIETEPLKAIKLLEEAKRYLSKEESFRNFIICSVGISVAYKQIELLWAARKELIAALNHFSTEYKRDSVDNYPLLLCSQQLIWCEILLGRVPQVLLWIEYSLIITKTIDSQQLSDEDFFEKFSEQDLLLTLLILKSSIKQLKNLPELVSILDELQLFASSNTLMYALGDFDEILNAYDIDKKAAEKDVNETYAYSLLRPEYGDLPDYPTYHFFRDINYSTRILGTKVTISMRNEYNLIYFAEDLLGSIEAFFSTVGLEDMILAFPHIKIKLSQSDFTSFPGRVLSSSKDFVIEVIINNNLSEFVSSTDQKEYRNFLLNIITRIFAASLSREKDNQKEKIEDLAKEGAFSRSLNISPSYLFLNNILGTDKKYKLTDWTEEENEKKYELKREKHWYDELDEDLREEIDNMIEEKNSHKTLDSKIVKHKDIERLDNYIVDEYWESAKWEGMFYIVPNEITGHNKPVLAFLFENPGSANQLFSDLINKVTSHDSSDIIDIKIIENVNENHDYIVIFTINPDAFKTNQRYLVLKHRSKLNHVTNYQQFKLFKQSIQNSSAYEIMPAVLKGDKPALGESLKIKKHNISFIDATEIEEGTMEYETLLHHREKHGLDRE